MKKIVLLILLFIGFLAQAQKPRVDYQRFAKKTTAQKLSIDVSDTSLTYVIYDTDLGRFEQNYGTGWVEWSGGSGENIYTTSGITPASSNRYLDIGSNGSFAIRTADFKNYLSITSNAVSLYNGYGNLRLRTGSGGTYDATTVGQVWTATDNVGGGKFQDAPNLSNYAQLNQANTFTVQQRFDNFLNYFGDPNGNHVRVYSGGGQYGTTIRQGTNLDNTWTSYMLGRMGFNNGDNTVYLRQPKTIVPGLYSTYLPNITADRTLAVSVNGSHADDNGNITVTTGGPSFSTFAELDALVADRGLVSLENNQTFTGVNTFTNASDISTLTAVNNNNIGLASGIAALNNTSLGYAITGSSTLGSTFISRSTTDLTGYHFRALHDDIEVYTLDKQGNVTANSITADGSNLTGVFKIASDSPEQDINIWSGNKAQWYAQRPYGTPNPTNYFSVITDSIPPPLYASDIINVPSGNLAAINVQLALDEIQTEIDGVGGLQNLQSVTDEGSTTSNTIIISSVTDKGVAAVQTGVGSTNYNARKIQIYDSANRSFTINSPTITANRTAEWQDKDYTGIADITDIVTTAAGITDFDTEVSNNATVTINSAKKSFETATATGTTIDMSGLSQDNFGSADGSATFTMENIAVGGYAEVLVNRTGAPTVTGATQFPNTATFIDATDMILCVKDFNGTRKYWFVEF